MFTSLLNPGEVYSDVELETRKFYHKATLKRALFILELVSSLIGSYSKLFFEEKMLHYKTKKVNMVVFP